MNYPIRSSGREKVYADDVLIYLDRKASFEGLMQLVEFGEASGLQVGWDKSQAFLIGPFLPYDTPNQYLGIQIHNDINQ